MKFKNLPEILILVLFVIIISLSVTLAMRNEKFTMVPPKNTSTVTRQVTPTSTYIPPTKKTSYWPIFLRPKFYQTPSSVNRQPTSTTNKSTVTRQVTPLTSN